MININYCAWMMPHYKLFMDKALAEMQQVFHWT